MDMLIVTDCLSLEDEELGRPLTGSVGWVLDKMLVQLGIDPKSVTILPVSVLKSITAMGLTFWIS